MQKYGVLLDIMNDFITFYPGYSTHLRASLGLILPEREEKEIISKARQ